MEKVFEQGNFPGDALVKIKLPEDSLAGLAKSVAAIGVTDSVVWPDLDGLAKEIKRQFGYGG